MKAQPLEINGQTVLAALRLFHSGEDRGATASELVEELTGVKARQPGQERVLRQVIEELRREGHEVCASPATGYFLALTPGELNRTCVFLYQRAMTSLAQVASMKRVALPDLRGQLGLPIEDETKKQKEAEHAQAEVP